MKKLFALLMAAMMLLCCVACGGGNDTAADDAAQADDQQQTADDTQSDSTNPLDVMEFIEVPDGLVGTSWEFCGGFVNGTEMSDEQATNTLKGCNGVLEIDFNDVDAVDYLNGDTVLTGSCGADEENMMVVITMPNGDGTSTDLTCLFADLNGTTIMVMLEGDDSNNGLYFRMIEEG